MHLSPSFRRRWPWLVVLAVVIVALVWWQWPKAPAEASAEPPPALAADGSLELSEEQIRTQGIAAAAAVTATTVPVPALPAQATAPFDASALVAVPYAGVVTRLLVDEGATVRKGTPLAVVHSREWLAAQAALAAARGEAMAATAQARRDRQLLTEGIIPEARDEQARARAEAANGALRQAEGALAALPPAPSGQPGEYALLAPMDGRVLRRDVRPGQAVAALDPAFTMARPGPLDVRFIASVRYRSVLAPGLVVGLPDGAQAQVVAVAADADPTSQSLRVRAQAEEDAGLLPGQQFAVTLQLPAPAGTLAVPTAALLPAGDGQVVFRLDGRRVRRIEVQEDFGGDTRIHVVRAAGLTSGAQVVVRGTAVLKALIPASGPTVANGAAAGKTE